LPPCFAHDAPIIALAANRALPFRHLALDELQACDLTFRLSSYRFQFVKTKKRYDVQARAVLDAFCGEVMLLQLCAV
jgi:hypothetical protein